ncbi:MAG: NAD(P)/FAD-dependent oxidoreductase [Balneolaceae bacterium]
MNRAASFDAVIVGSGPNGLSAAILLAQNGLSVKVIEAKETIGGGTRTLELTEPGFLHDVCSAVHPTALSSPFLRALPLQQFGLEWIHPEVPVAHPLEDGQAFTVSRSLDETLLGLGKDSRSYQSLYKSFTDNWETLSNDLFGTLRSVRYPFSMARFGWYGMFSAKHLANSLFKNPELKAFFAGMAAHSIVPLEKAFTASFGIVLGTSVHSVGWPIAKGGSASISYAMAEYFKSLGGVIETGNMITSVAQIEESNVILFDLTPHQIATIAGSKLPPAFKSRLEKFQYGPGAFKIDWALSESVPWLNEKCRKAGTLHLGGSLEEISFSEQEIWKGNYPDKPYVIISQPSVFDSSRAPEGKHTLWGYCHVPNGSEEDCTEQIENQIERYAPGFRDTIISKNTMTATQFQSYNPNYIGGDINGGAQFFKQLFARPVLKWDPYALPAKGLYICSSSTPPGGGVHGMCGFHAARSVLKNEFGVKEM